MPNINTEFSEEEYKILNVAKAQSNMGWHDFLLSLVGYKIQKVSK